MDSSNSHPADRPGELGGTISDLLPARMVHEYAYCPRLAYVEWVQPAWFPRLPRRGPIEATGFDACSNAH